MVNEDLVSKENNADDPSVKRLREKLAKLRGEENASEDATSNESTQATQSQQDDSEEDIEELAKASEQERRRFAQETNPQLRVKEERTHKLVAKQVSELIELTTELQKRIKKLEQQNKSAHQEIERVEKRNEEMREKMKLIDGRLEKFMGLYEIITNQYNPFADQQAPQNVMQDNSEQAQEQPQEQLGGGSGKVSVADNLRGEEEVVEYSQGEMSSENKRKINQLISELEEQEREESREPSEEVSEEVEAHEQEVQGALKGEFDELFAGFEERMKQYVDESLQDRLHNSLSEIEDVLVQEVSEAVDERLDELTSHEKTLSSAFEELASLEQQSSDFSAYQASERALEQEVEELDEKIKAIPPQLYFQLHSGAVLKSKEDLLVALKEMPEEVFSYHVTDSHNDFADWLELALEDSVGASLRGKSRSQMIALLSENN